MKFIIILTFLFFETGLFAKDLGTWGTTYQIVENDVLNHMKRNASKMDWGELTSRGKSKKMLRKFRPRDMADILPRASEDKIYIPDLSDITKEDIKGKNGQILYPKGYRYDPSKHLILTNKYVLFNADDPVQMKWFQSSKLNEDIRVKVLVIGRNFPELSKKLHRPVYYLPQLMIRRLGLKKLPAIFEHDYVVNKPVVRIIKPEVAK